MSQINERKKLRKKIVKLSLFRPRIFKKIFDKEWIDEEERQKGISPDRLVLFDHTKIEFRVLFKYYKKCLKKSILRSIWNFIAHYQIVSILSIFLAIYMYLNSYHPNEQEGNSITQISTVDSTLSNKYKKTLSISSSYKFRVLFDINSVNIDSNKIQVWINDKWLPSSFNIIIDTLVHLIAINSLTNNIYLKITGHADDTVANLRLKEKINCKYANERRSIVKELLENKIIEAGIKNVSINENENVPWWYVDGYDARHSPGENPDFRVALIIIKQSFTIKR